MATNFEILMQELKGMNPDELVNAYIEAKAGKNYNDDIIPVEMLSGAKNNLQEIVEYINAMQN